MFKSSWSKVLGGFILGTVGVPLLKSEEGLPICYGRCIYCKGSYSGRNRGFPGICIGRGRGCKAYHGRILSEKGCTV